MAGEGGGHGAGPQHGGGIPPQDFLPPQVPPWDGQPMRGHAAPPQRPPAYLPQQPPGAPPRFSGPQHPAGPPRSGGSSTWLPIAVIAAVLVLVAGGGFLAYTLFTGGTDEAAPPTGDDASEVVFPESVGDFALRSQTTTANPSDMGQDVPTAAYMSEQGNVFVVYAIPGVDAAGLMANFKVTDPTEVDGTICGGLPDSADRRLCSVDATPHGVGVFSVSGGSDADSAAFAIELATTIG